MLLLSSHSCRLGDRELEDRGVLGETLEHVSFSLRRGLAVGRMGPEEAKTTMDRAVQRVLC